MDTIDVKQDLQHLMATKINLAELILSIEYVSVMLQIVDENRRTTVEEIKLSEEVLLLRASHRHRCFGVDLPNQRSSAKYST